MIQKLTQEEINELIQIQTQRQSILEKLGALELESIVLEYNKTKLKESYLNIFNQEQIIGTILQQKYGDGTIDIDKGEITTLD